MLSDKEMDEILEYEMDDDDLDWLTKDLPDKKLQIKEDKFEQIMDRLEKESFKQVRATPVTRDGCNETACLQTARGFGLSAGRKQTFRV